MLKEERQLTAVESNFGAAAYIAILSDFCISTCILDVFLRDLQINQSTFRSINTWHDLPTNQSNYARRLNDLIHVFNTTLHTTLFNNISQDNQ